MGSWPGHPDHIVTWDSTCVGAEYRRLRTARWVFKEAQPNTVPLYRGYREQEQHHFASTHSHCEGLAKNEALLGYALAH